MKNRLRNEKGITLIVLLSLLLIMTIIGIGVVIESTNEVKIGGNEGRNTNSFWAAEGGAEKAIAAIRTNYQAYGMPPSPLPCDTFISGNYTVTYSTIDNGPAVQATLTTGSYAGLYALVKSFTITSTGTENTTGEKSQITQVIQDALVPVYQFAVFYEKDLEICPGPVMTLGGRVHTNSNMYIGSENTLNIVSRTTAAGNIHHGRKAGSGMPAVTGNVMIEDANGIYQNMKNTDGSWLDSDYPNWTTSSTARWGGKVEDKAHGITELYLPVVRSGDQIDMIKRGAGNPDSYENQAKLRIVDGTALYRVNDTTWSDVTANLTASGTIHDTVFFDAREGKHVTSTDIDIGKLNSSGYFPSNGVLYASREVIRLVNGSQVLAPVTIATDNPLYTVGNFNTSNKKPVGLMTDALTILSGSWNDAKSDSSLSKRVASNTTVNCCFMTGNQNTGEGGSSYNGGLENLIRFLERWDNKTMIFRGSMVDIWNSEQAVGHWSYAYYTAPNRDWRFDTDLLDPANLPPGYPKLNILQKASWSEE